MELYLCHQLSILYTPWLNLRDQPHVPIFLPLGGTFIILERSLEMRFIWIEPGLIRMDILKIESRYC